MIQPSKDIITKASDLMAHIRTIANNLPVHGGDASRGGAQLKNALDRLIKAIEDDGLDGAMTVTAFHFMDSPDISFTIHPHKTMEEAIQHAHEVTNGSPRIPDQDCRTVICAFALSDDSSQGVTPESAIGLIRRVPHLVGDDWNRNDVYAVMNHAVTRLCNAEDAGHLMVVLGQRKTSTSVEFAEPFGTSSESEAKDHVTLLKQQLYLATSLATFRSKCHSKQDEV